MKEHAVIILGIIFLTLLLTVKYCAAEHKMSEDEYNRLWCREEAGVLSPETYEVRIEAGGLTLYIDCATPERVYEMDFAPKYNDGLGQANTYSTLTGKPGGLVLIIEEEREWRFYWLIKYVNQVKGMNLDIRAIDNVNGKWGSL